MLKPAFKHQHERFIKNLVDQLFIYLCTSKKRHAFRKNDHSLAVQNATAYIKISIR